MKKYTGTASVPFARSKSLEDNSIQKVHLIGIVGLGSGVNCGLMKIQFYWIEKYLNA